VGQNDSGINISYEGLEQGDLTEAELNELIEGLCNSKAEEFQMLGYEQVSGRDIWECVSDGYRKGTPRLHRLVNDILTLKVTQFMNWNTMNVYRGTLG
jgi:hypothetical protein